MEINRMNSVTRADAAAAIGLTEISKQMRKMRATNQKQTEEIRRLKKQIQVLSETRGITITNVQNAFENAALKDADKELQRRYNEMKIRAEEAETALLNRNEDKGLHERIGELELKAVMATENDMRSQQQLKELVARLKDKETEMSNQQQEIIALNQQKQDAVLKSASVDVKTTSIIKDLQNKLSAMNIERKQIEGVLRDLSWQNEEIKQRERRAVLDAEKCYIELSSKVADITDLEQRLQSMHFAYTLVEKDMRDEQKLYQSQKAQQEAADLALVQTIVKSNKKIVEEKQKQKKLKEQVLQAERKLTAGAPALPSSSVTMVEEPARVVGVIEKKSPKTATKSPTETCELSLFANAVCDGCNTLCCDSTGARISDSRVCSVCALFYCPSCKRQNLTRRGPNVYKHPQCVGSKTQYLYPY